MIHVCFSEQPRRFGKLSDRHSKVNDAQTYEIKTKISATKQVTRTVTGYLSLLQGLWQEIDHYQCIQMHCCEGASILKRFVEKKCIYDFLVGLNVKFDAVRMQILEKLELRLS